jgi:F-type H+-transporting ATPase subunit gamma
MPSLKTLRNRIASVKATQKITKAMQMVAASKLRRAQAAAEAARPFAVRMGTVLANLAQSFTGRADAPKLLAGTGGDARHLLIVCTAERGLCGAFNSSIARLAREHAYRLQRDGKDVKFFCVGRKGYDALRRLFAKQILEVVELRGIKQVEYSHAAGIAAKVLALFAEGKFDVATLYFSEFKSVIRQVPTALQLIPAKLPAAKTAAGPEAVHEYEPSEEEVLDYLATLNVSTQIFRGLLENVASFYGAQMSAMDSATRNAGEMIDKLTLRYNRTRQAMITKELIEIISGAEAV